MKMSELINFRLKVSTTDGRHLTGTLLAFDGHMNLVLGDTDEARLTKKGYAELVKTKQANYQSRQLGLIILRGDQIVSMTIQLEPVTPIKSRLELGTGVAKGVKRKRDD